MRDSNPMPALARLRKAATGVLKEAGFDLRSFDVIPSESDDGLHRVRLVVTQVPADDETVKAETTFVEMTNQPDAPFVGPTDDTAADEARERLTSLKDRLKRNDGGILDE